MNYFNKFPTFTYNNNVAKNLLARARLSDQVRKTKTAFYPYTIEEGDRADILSNLYYENPGYSWLIWLTNNHIDPYYDTPLDDQDFNDFIKQKYGSYTLANRKIYYYRNNWADNIDQTLTRAEFDALTNGTQKYYQPVLDNVLNVAKYVRKREDDKIETNKVITFDVSSVTGTFTVGEEVRTDTSNYAFVTFANSSVITAKHVNGSLSSTITGQESGATATVGTVTTIAETLASTESSFWSPVTFYEHENELNESKKAIKLLSTQYRAKADSDLKRVMKKR